MRVQAAVFLGLAFVAYWLLTGEPGDEKQLSLGPVKPGIVSVLNPPYDLEEPVHTGQVSSHDEPESLKQWLHAEAARIGGTDADPVHTAELLGLKASQFGDKEIHFLKHAALNRALANDERFLAVYMLSLAGNGALDALRELSLARIPGVPDDRRHSDEVILRTQAIEALVQKLSPAEARAWLQELLSRTSDPIIARHVQYWLNRLSS